MHENPYDQKQKLNHQLYKKVQSELAAFHKEMLAKTPEEIYEAAHEIAVKHEIAKVFVDSNFFPLGSAVLLKVPNLLQDIYNEWEKGGVLTKDGMKMFVGYVAIYKKYKIHEEIKKFEPER